jgi:hypothetical protein
VCELVREGGPQLSDAVGTVQLTFGWQEAPALIVISAVEQPLITGAVLSFTITLNAQVAILPDASDAVYVTNVVPIPNELPGVCVLVKFTALQRSVADGAVHEATAWQKPFAFKTMSEDKHSENTGATSSTTTTLNVQRELFPAASVAV